MATEADTNSCKVDAAECEAQQEQQHTWRDFVHLDILERPQPCVVTANATVMAQPWHTYTHARAGGRTE